MKFRHLIGITLVFALWPPSRGQGADKVILPKLSVQFTSPLISAGTATWLRI